MLAGCAAVPDEVNKNIGNRETGNTGKENSDLKGMELRPVSEVTAETPDNWTKESGKVKFDGIVKAPEVSELYKWKVEISTEAYENPEKAREVFLKYFDNLAIEERDEPGDECGGMVRTIDYKDEEELPGEDGSTDGIAMYATGQFAMGMLTKFWSDVDEGEEWLHGLRTETAKTYYFREDGTCIEGGEDTWTIYGGESVTIQEMMDCMQEFAGQYKKVEPSAVFVPDRVEVWKMADRDFYAIDVCEMLLYDGVRVDDAWFAEPQNIKEYGNLCRLRSQMSQEVHYTDGYPYGTSVNTPYRRSEKLETYDKILGFEDAWSLLTGKIADQKNVDFDRADLLYSIWYEPEGDSDELWWNTLSEPPQMFATPVWRFSGWVDKGEENAKQCTVYVDALTGQVTAYQ